MAIRKTTMEDIPRLMEIYAIAREFMKNSGNPTQWGNNHPPKSILEHDAEAGVGYAMCDDDGTIYATFAFIIGDDPTYRDIYDGEWLDDDPYGTIHRIASDGTHRGIMKECVSFCESIIPNLRIDTHNDNKVMQHQIEKNGFTKCGTIYVEDGSPRIAYQKNNKQ